MFKVSKKFTSSTLFSGSYQRLGPIRPSYQRFAGVNQKEEDVRYRNGRSNTKEKQMEILLMTIKGGPKCKASSGINQPRLWQARKLWGKLFKKINLVKYLWMWIYHIDNCNFGWKMFGDEGKQHGIHRKYKKLQRMHRSLNWFSNEHYILRHNNLDTERWSNQNTHTGSKVQGSVCVCVLEAMIMERAKFSYSIVERPQSPKLKN